MSNQRRVIMYEESWSIICTKAINETGLSVKNATTKMDITKNEFTAFYKVIPLTILGQCTVKVDLLHLTGDVF